MPSLLRTLATLIPVLTLALLANTAFGQKPFNSSQPGYPKGSPFSDIEWENETTVRVKVEQEWYELRTVEDISVEAIIQKCKKERWDLEKRFSEDLLQLLRLMGKKTGDTLSLTLVNDSGEAVELANAPVSKVNRRQLLDKTLRAEMAILAKGNPFFSGAPNYPKQSPFSAVKWIDGKPLVQLKDQWYRPASLQGVSYNEIVEKCKKESWPLKLRFTEDVIQILRLMGKDVDKTIDLELIDNEGVNHRFEQVVVAYRPRFSTASFDVAAVKSDLDSLQQQLESQFAYLKANGFNYVAAIEELRANAKEFDNESKLAKAIAKKVINQFIDGHASVRGARISSRQFLPFLIEVSGDRYVAINADRKDFFDSKHPYISQIDGKTIDEWIAIAEPYSPKGSTQYRRRNGLRMLRSLPQLRSDAKMPESNTLSVVLAQDDATKTVTKELDLSDDYPIYGLWPRATQSRLMDEGYGYLRIASMDEEAVESIQKWMPKFKDTNGLIVDVRGNGGGIRLPLIELADYLMRPEDPPRIGNVAKYRLHPGFDDNHLSEARYVYRESSSRFEDRERAAIDTFKQKFRPEWEPEASEFSEWHYMVLAKKASDKEYFYSKPVVVLCDEKCFSATDIFLGAFKGWPNVTLVGQPSGGGSARSQGFKLKNTEISIRCASMASFQPNGKLYDTHGVEPDVFVTRTPSYFLLNGEDVILDKAIELLSQNTKQKTSVNQ